MCGRYRLSIDQQELLDTYVAELFLEAWQPRYNIAPSQTVPVVVQEGEGRRIEGFCWGLVPSWAKDPSIGNRMINARSETVGEKPSFRGAWRQGRRCLVPANGFYEWQNPLQDKAPKVPHSIQAADGRPFAFAGLWESWNGSGKTLRTFTILTTEASPGLRRIHERMPVILGDSEAWKTWLDPRIPGSDLEPLFRPWPDEELHAYPVSTWVNRPNNDGPECMQPVDAGPLPVPET